ncbi:MAG: carboxymuconolactone decarboxylase family protein [Chloroflexi bacterium]|nr:carboxymuconolactone decarboxylase family protein [Chloroflexota bacterium]
MPRLEPQTFDTLDDDQRVLWDNITTGPRGNPEREHGGLAGADGALIGPFNALFQSPLLGDAIQKLGAAVRYETSLPNDLLEVAICTMGGHWRANFEFWAHARLAKNAGVSEGAIDAIRDGEQPFFGDQRQQTVYQFGRELIEHQRVSDETYESLKGMIGERGVFEVASVMGYYALVSIGLNTFNVAMPPGVEPPFDD